MLIANNYRTGLPNREETPVATRSLERGAFARESMLSVFVLALFALPLPYLLRFDHSHAVIAAVLGLVMCGLCVYSRQGAVVAASIFLAFLGDYRRYAGYFAGYPESDALLLVGPAIAFFLVCQGLVTRSIGA